MEKQSLCQGINIAFSSSYLGQQCIAAPACTASREFDANGSRDESILISSGGLIPSSTHRLLVSSSIVGDRSPAMTLA